MCYFTITKPNVKLPINLLEYHYRNNPDGCGFAFINNGKLEIEKGFFDFDEFAYALKKVPKESPVICHLRQGTSGGVNKENCHPFYIDENHALVHYCSFSCGGSNGRSDTRRFAEDFLRPIFKELDKEWLQPDNKVEKLMDEMLCGKAAIMDNEGRIKTYNMDNWNDGLICAGF